MSHIQYKFLSGKEFSDIIFDGLSISVVDLKQEILREQKLDPEEFDLVISNEQTSEKYQDGLTLIPKNTRVLVRRVPYTGPKISRMVNAASRAMNQQQQQQQHHGSGHSRFSKGSMNQNNNNNNAANSAATTLYGYRGPQGTGMLNKNQNQNQNGTQDDSALEQDAMNDAEDARIAAMFQQSNEQWEHQKSIMEKERPVFVPRNQGGGYMRPRPQGPPPPNYICHRCGKPDHWIYNCPTMNQANEDGGTNHYNRSQGHKIKRTTGIPKSFLQKVDNIDAVGNALVTQDGTLVVATANEAAWNMAQQMAGGGGLGEDEESMMNEEVPDSLKCNICYRIARDAAVATPCCKTVFCSSCIEKQLLEPGDMHFTCPVCHTKDIVPDKLETASEVREKVEEFLKDYAIKRQQQQAQAALEASKAQQKQAANSSDSNEQQQSATSTNGQQQQPNNRPPSNPMIIRQPAQIPPRPLLNANQMRMMPPSMMGMGMGMMMPRPMYPMGMPRPPQFMRPLPPPSSSQQQHQQHPSATTNSSSGRNHRSRSRNHYSGRDERRHRRDRSRSPSRRHREHDRDRDHHRGSHRSNRRRHGDNSEQKQHRQDSKSRGKDDQTNRDDDKDKDKDKDNRHRHSRSNRHRSPSPSHSRSRNSNDNVKSDRPSVLDRVGGDDTSSTSSKRRSRKR